MSKVSQDLDSMMVAIRRSEELGCRGAHRDSNGRWAACSSAAELKRLSAIKKRPLSENVRIRDRKGSNRMSSQWEPLAQRGVAGIATLDGGGLVSASFAKTLKETDLEVYGNIETARQRARQLGCIGVARRYTASGKEIWTPCTNMSDLARLAGLTPLGRRGQRLAAQRTITDALERQKKRGRRSGKGSRPTQFNVKKLSGRLGGGLRIPPPGMVFVDVSGAIDGDRDGIVNEGRPDERPIIPARMISEAIAASLPSPTLSSSSRLSSVSVSRAPAMGRMSRETRSQTRGTSSALFDRLSDDEKAFLKRMSRNLGYASEAPDRIMLAAPPELRDRVERNNVMANVAAMRSMSSTKPSGGRAMSDVIIGRIDPDRFGNPEPTMFFIGGTMGAGKSTLVSDYGDQSGIPPISSAAHIDPDEIKTALPGWNGGKGASAVHAQSRVVTDKILERALSGAVDIVIQGTGKRNEHLHMARQSKYRTVGHYVWVPSDMSAARINQRASRGGTKVDPYLGPLIASELRELTHRQVTGGLLDEFYLWDNTEGEPKLIASFDGDSVFTINDESAFYDFFGKYGGDRVKAHWASIGSQKTRTGMKSRTQREPEVTQIELGQSMPPRIVASGFTKDSPLSLDALKGRPLRNASLDGNHLKPGSNFSEISAPFMSAERLYAPGVRFSGSDLFAANMSRANLFRAKFGSSEASQKPTDLRFAHLSYIQAPNSDFTSARLNGANLTGSNLQGAVLRNADMRGADLNGANLKGADLSGAQLDQDALRNAILDDQTVLPNGEFASPRNAAQRISSEAERTSPLPPIPLSARADDDAALLSSLVIDGRLISIDRPLNASGSRLERRDLRNSQLRGVDLSNSALDGTTLDRSQIQDSSFVGAMMEQARLSKSNLSGVNLRGILGRRIRFTGSTLSNVDLRGSDLREAMMENMTASGRVDLRGADLRGAFLAGADLRKAVVDGNTRLNGARTDRRTKLPPNIDKDRLGVPMRSRSNRDFDDYLLAEVVEDARYSGLTGSESIQLESSGLSNQHRFIRGQVVTRALARLIARDIDNFGSQLTDREHRNINQRLMMLRDLQTQAQQAREASLAIEELGQLSDLSDLEAAAYIDKSLFGSLSDDLLDLRLAAEQEFPSYLQNMNDISAFIAERKQRRDQDTSTLSAVDKVYQRLMGESSLTLPAPGSKRGRSEKAMRDAVMPRLVSPSSSTDGMRSSSRARELSEATTKALIESLETAEADKWERPWQLQLGIPKNAITGKHYRGWNIFWLAMAQRNGGYDKPVWATYKQWSEMGGQVRKGQKGTAAIKWSPVTRKLDDGSEETSSRMVPYAFTLFNLDQVDGIEPSQFDIQLLPESARVDRMETILGEMGIQAVGDNTDRAYYDPVNDVINMPPFSSFRDAKAYYATLAHEAVHWTGSSKRLDRSNMHRFGTPEYAYEELVAEIGSAMLMSLMGLDPEPQPHHAQYIKGWLRLLKEQPDALHKAITDAQKAIDFLIESSPTLKRDMQPVDPDADTFGENTQVDALQIEAEKVASIAMRSATRDERIIERPTMNLFVGQADKTPLSIDEVASMSDDKVAMLVTEDRMNGLTADELAAKYHLSRPQVLGAVRRYLAMLESGKGFDSAPKEPTLVTRRDGIAQRIRISEMTRQESEIALQYVRREIQRAKNARELRNQKDLEDRLISQIERLESQELP